MIKSLLRLIFRRPSTPAIRLPDPSAIAPEQLDEFSRREIREWLASPTTQRVLSLVERAHPGRNVPFTTVKSEFDKDAAVCWMHRVRGWETHRNAILNILYVPPQSGDVPETYQTPN